MDFHPSQIPIVKIFHLKDEKDASEAAQEMVKIGFFSENKGFKVLMSKNNTKIAKRIGYTVTTGVTLNYEKLTRIEILDIGPIMKIKKTMR